MPSQQRRVGSGDGVGVRRFRSYKLAAAPSSTSSSASSIVSLSAPPLPRPQPPPSSSSSSSSVSAQFAAFRYFVDKFEADLAEHTALQHQQQQHLATSSSARRPQVHHVYELGTGRVSTRQSMLPSPSSSSSSSLSSSSSDMRRCVAIFEHNYDRLTRLLGRVSSSSSSSSPLSRDSLLGVWCTMYMLERAISTPSFPFTAHQRTVMSTCYRALLPLLLNHRHHHAHGTINWYERVCVSWAYETRMIAAADTMALKQVQRLHTHKSRILRFLHRLHSQRKLAHARLHFLAWREYTSGRRRQESLLQIALLTELRLRLSQRRQRQLRVQAKCFVLWRSRIHFEDEEKTARHHILSAIVRMKDIKYRTKVNGERESSIRHQIHAMQEQLDELDRQQQQASGSVDHHQHLIPCQLIRQRTGLSPSFLGLLEQLRQSVHLCSSIKPHVATLCDIVSRTPAIASRHVDERLAVPDRHKWPENMRSEYSRALDVLVDDEERCETDAFNHLLHWVTATAAMGTERRGSTSNSGVGVGVGVGGGGDANNTIITVHEQHTQVEILLVAWLRYHLGDTIVPTQFSLSMDTRDGLVYWQLLSLVLSSSSSSSLSDNNNSDDDPIDWPSRMRWVVRTCAKVCNDGHDNDDDDEEEEDRIVHQLVYGVPQRHLWLLCRLFQAIAYNPSSHRAVDDDWLHTQLAPIDQLEVSWKQLLSDSSEEIEPAQLYEHVYQLSDLTAAIDTSRRRLNRRLGYVQTIRQRMQHALDCLCTCQIVGVRAITHLTVGSQHVHPADEIVSLPLLRSRVRPWIAQHSSLVDVECCRCQSVFDMYASSLYQVFVCYAEKVNTDDEQQQQQQQQHTNEASGLCINATSWRRIRVDIRHPLPVSRAAVDSELLLTWPEFVLSLFELSLTAYPSIMSPSARFQHLLTHDILAHGRRQAYAELVNAIHNAPKNSECGDVIRRYTPRLRALYRVHARKQVILGDVDMYTSISVRKIRSMLRDVVADQAYFDNDAALLSSICNQVRANRHHHATYTPTSYWPDDNHEELMYSEWLEVLACVAVYIHRSPFLSLHAKLEQFFQTLFHS